MSASTWGDRSKRRTPTAIASPNVSPSWVNRDFSGQRKTTRRRGMIPLLIIALVVALGVAALRIDLIRIRYAMASATETENRLIEERRALIARKRQLRDPTALAVEARARGFRPPAVAYSIPNPATNPGTTAAPALAEAPAAIAVPTQTTPPRAAESDSLPAVAAAPDMGMGEAAR